jgi:hypothetical protein
MVMNLLSEQVTCADTVVSAACVEQIHSAANKLVNGKELTHRRPANAVIGSGTSTAHAAGTDAHTSARSTVV